jgi:hypothetical protein
MITLAEAPGRARVNLPNGVPGHREATVQQQSQPLLLHSTPTQSAFEDISFRDKPEWSDRAIIALIAVMAVLAAFMWTGIGAALWWILAA